MMSLLLGIQRVTTDLYLPALPALAQGFGADLPQAQLTLSGLGVLACLSAPLGGLLSQWLGWRAALLALFGAGALALIALRFVETVPHKNPLALRPATLLGTWKHIITHPTFLTFSALTAAAYGGLFTFLVSSSFVFIKLLGISKTQYGLVMFSMSSCYILGTFLCRHLLPRCGVRKTVGLAAVLSLTGGTTLGVLPLLGVTSVWSVMLPFLVFMVGHGVHQPCGPSGAVNPFPKSAGAASALNGFLMMVVAFAMGGWLATQGAASVQPLTSGVRFWSVCIAATAWTAVQRHGEAKPV